MASLGLLGKHSKDTSNFMNDRKRKPKGNGNEGRSTSKLALRDISNRRKQPTRKVNIDDNSCRAAIDHNDGYCYECFDGGGKYMSYSLFPNTLIYALFSHVTIIYQLPVYMVRIDLL